MPSASLLLRSRIIPPSVLLPYFGLGLYLLASAFLIGMGRVGFGSAWAMNSRYVSLTYLFWVVNLVFLYLLIRNPETKRKHPICPLGGIFLGAAAVFLTLWSSLGAVSSFRLHHKILTPARAELLSMKNEDVLTRLHLIERVKKYVPILQNRRLSVFRKTQDGVTLTGETRKKKM